VNARRYTMRANDDGTATATFGATETTWEAQPNPYGRIKVRFSVETRPDGHHKTITDGGAKATLTCGCDELTVVVEGGTADSRAAYAAEAHDQHLARLQEDQ